MSKTGVKINIKKYVTRQKKYYKEYQVQEFMDII